MQNKLKKCDWLTERRFLQINHEFIILFESNAKKIAAISLKGFDEIFFIGICSWVAFLPPPNISFIRLLLLYLTLE